MDTNQTIYTGDCHLVPQYQYLTDSYGNKVENILHQENLNEELNKFIKKYNLNIELSNERKEEKKRNFKKDNLNDNSVRLIQKYYKKDFEELNYR